MDLSQNLRDLLEDFSKVSTMTIKIMDDYEELKKQMIDKDKMLEELESELQKKQKFLELVHTQLSVIHAQETKISSLLKKMEVEKQKEDEMNRFKTKHMEEIEEFYRKKIVSLQEHYEKQIQEQKMMTIIPGPVVNPAKSSSLSFPTSTVTSSSLKKKKVTFKLSSISSIS